tara:strand:- start:2269 stop:2433 length:165 start_codon:yes stop_codon:yes gene_type:complete
MPSIKKKIMKPIKNVDEPNSLPQHNIHKALENEKKIKPSKVFDGYIEKKKAKKK